MPKLNKTDFTFRIRRGLRANLFAATTYWAQGEPAYTTDTKHLFIADDSRNPDGGVPQPVQTLDMVMTHNGVIQTHNGRPVVHY